MTLTGFAARLSGYSFGRRAQSWDGATWTLTTMVTTWRHVVKRALCSGTLPDNFGKSDIRVKGAITSTPSSHRRIFMCSNCNCTAMHSYDRRVCDRRVYPAIWPSDTHWYWVKTNEHMIHHPVAQKLKIFPDQTLHTRSQGNTHRKELKQDCGV